MKNVEELLKLLSDIGFTTDDDTKLLSAKFFPFNTDKMPIITFQLDNELGKYYFKIDMYIKYTKYILFDGDKTTIVNYQVSQAIDSLKEVFTSKMRDSKIDQLL